MFVLRNVNIYKNYSEKTQSDTIKSQKWIWQQRYTTKVITRNLKTHKHRPKEDKTIKKMDLANREFYSKNVNNKHYYEKKP